MRYITKIPTIIYNYIHYYDTRVSELSKMTANY